MISQDYVLCYIPRALEILAKKCKLWNLLVRRRRPLRCQWRPLCGFEKIGGKVQIFGFSSEILKVLKIMKNFEKLWVLISKVGSKFWHCPKTAILGPKLAFLAKNWHFGPIWSDGRPKKQCKQGAYVDLLLYGYQNFDLLSLKVGIFGTKTAKCGPKLAFFGHFGLNFGFLIHLMPCPINKTMRTRCLSGFLISGYQNFCSLLK